MSSFCIKVFKINFIFADIAMLEVGEEVRAPSEGTYGIAIGRHHSCYVSTMRHTLLLRRRNTPLSLQIPVGNHSSTNM